MIALLLTSHLVPRDVKPLRASQFWHLIDRFEELERLVGASPSEIEAETSVTYDEAQTIAELLRGAASFAFELEDLERRGITLLSAFDERYPAAFRTKLGSAAPPALYVAGPAELLETDGIAIVGARDVDPKAAHVAGDAARLLASRGLTVYSGAAKGIDQVAMNSAFSAGGVVVGVLADSLERRLRDSDTRRAILDGRVCLFTPYKPSMGFTVANAMARNKLIYALARKTLVVQADLEKGGTWAGATEWLRRAPDDVLVWTGPGRGEGNETLVRAGGRGIDRIAQLVEEEEIAVENPEVEQLGFGV